MSNDEVVLDDLGQREKFLEAIALGTPEYLAGDEVKWSPRKVAKICAEPEMAELIAYAKIRAVDGIEKILFETARGGNFQAQAMILFNLRPEKFRDVKRIEVANTGTVMIEHVHSTKQALKELMAEQGAGMFQIGGPLDAIEAQSREATDDSG